MAFSDFCKQGWSLRWASDIYSVSACPMITGRQPVYWKPGTVSRARGPGVIGNWAFLWFLLMLIKGGQSLPLNCSPGLGVISHTLTRATDRSAIILLFSRPTEILDKPPIFFGTAFIVIFLLGILVCLLGQSLHIQRTNILFETLLFPPYIIVCCPRRKLFLCHPFFFPFLY